ncbi:MAG: hypothetical protein ING41_15805 [Burkholderiales bacterium]|nr:hypothetical protein [Burkholderiales bacterium]
MTDASSPPRVLLGCSVHWHLSELRESLALDVMTQHFVHGARQGRQGGLPTTNPEHADQINRLVAGTFEALKDRELFAARRDELMNVVLDVDNVFMHVALATGAGTLLYHGDDDNTPRPLSTARGIELLGPQFAVLPREELDRARAEVNQLFPSLQKVTWDQDIPWEVRKPIVMLGITLIDMLVAMRCDARLILFNPYHEYGAATRRFGLQELVQMDALVRTAERTNGSIVVPASGTELTGLRSANFFGSPEYIRYAQAHTELAHHESAASRSVGRLASSVTSLHARYEKFVNKSAINLIAVGAVEKAMALVTGGITANTKAYVDALLKLSKERNRSPVIYSGVDIQKYCEELVLLKLWGKPSALAPVRNWFAQSRLLQRLPWRR